MSVDTCERSGNMFSPTTKRPLGSDPHSSHRKDEGGKSESSLDSILSDKEGLIEEFEEEDDSKGPVPMLMRLVQTSWILIRDPTY